MSEQVQRAAAQMLTMSCGTRCLLIIAAKSPLHAADPVVFFDTAGKDGATLGDVMISNAKADRELRHDINRTFGKNNPPGSYSSATKIGDILVDSCEGAP